MVWATFWATFLQKHLVTLARDREQLRNMGGKVFFQIF
jgi:hypothetical protein